MGFAFPPSPLVGQRVTNPGGVTYQWSSTGGWVQVGIGQTWPPPFTPGVPVEFPENPQIGDTFETPAGIVYVYTNYETWAALGSTAIPASWFMAGAGPPLPAMGYEGCYYLDISSGQLYGPFNNGIWPPPADFIPMEGPEGPPGLQGPQGEQGIEGPVGSVGPYGPPGPTGPEGPIGTGGPQGIQGLQGPPGEWTIIIGAFSNQPPSALPPNGTIPASWDTPGVPPNLVYMPLQGGLVDTNTLNLWKFVGQTVNPEGWVNVGHIQGPPGTTGIQGPQGIQGAQGPTGPYGLQGPTGSQGPVGPVGPKGDYGVQGIEGPVGPPGQAAVTVGSFSVADPSTLPPDGLLPAGWDTPTNPRLPYQMSSGQGLIDTRTSHIWVYVGTDLSITGWVDLGSMVAGPQGIQGVQGPPGPEGLGGPVGPAGPQGIAGPQGTQGVIGPQGPMGPVGPQGIQGNAGPQGPIGNQGAQGVQGPAGPQGIAGTTTLVVGSFTNNSPSSLPPNGYIPQNWDGNGNPALNMTMIPGQSLVYTVDDSIWCFIGQTFNAAGWINLGNAQGPAGPPGTPGAAGPMGGQGPIGPAGAAGPVGPVGPQGVQGQQGTPGVTGPQGPEGPQGAPGQTAIIVGSFSNRVPADLPVNGLLPQDWDSVGNPPAPFQMSMGQALVEMATEDIWSYVGVAISATGWMNLGATQGPPGPQGIQGQDGPQGPEGPQGPQGPDGAVGSVGPQGPQGIQGPIGPQGIQGEDGTSAVIVGQFTNNNPSQLPPNGLIPANWDGPGNPASNLQMQLGQALLYTVANELYCWVGQANAVGGWIALGAVQGPQGPAGATGPQGAQGPMGAAGPQGTPGAAGAAGPPGAQGPSGPAGPQGPPGPGIADAPNDGNIYGRKNQAWSAVSAAVSVGSAPPASPQVGQLWWDTLGGQLYVWYNDGTSTQWVIAVNQTAPAGIAEAPTDGKLYGRSNLLWSPALPLAGGTMTGALVLNANPIAALQAAPKQYVDAAIAAVGSGIPVGSITMWSGATAPSNWLLCDGTVYQNSAIPALAPVLNNQFGGVVGTSNAVPNLNQKFPFGAGGGTLGATGGEATHTLVDAEMASHAHGVYDPGHNHYLNDPTHAHGISDGGHNHGFSDPGHAHSVADPGHAHGNVQQTGAAPYYCYGGSNWYGAGQTAGSGVGIGIYGAGTGCWNNASGTGIGIYGNYTGVYNSAAGTGIGIYADGGGQPHNNMPPYLQINFIIKYQ